MTVTDEGSTEDALFYEDALPMSEAIGAPSRASWAPRSRPPIEDALTSEDALRMWLGIFEGRQFVAGRPVLAGWVNLS